VSQNRPNFDQTVTVTPATCEFGQNQASPTSHHFMALQTMAHGGLVATNVGLHLAHRGGFVDFPWQNGLVLNAPSIHRNLVNWLGEEPQLPADIDFTILTVSV
jgi:hypothetical protein